MSSDNQNQPGERVYVDDRDLARLTPISRAQWQAWRHRGEGPPWRKVGRRVLYHWARDVVPWLEAQGAKGPS